MLKKILSAVSAITLAAVCSATAVSAALLGDVDDSGTVDIEDAVIILNDINGVKALEASAVSAADVDTNGQVDIEDVVAIINEINGVRTIVKVPDSLDSLEAYLKANGALTSEPRKEPDPSDYSAEKAVEYTGAVTIIQYKIDSTGYKKLLNDMIYTPDGEHVGFQGLFHTETNCYAYFFDFSDYEGSHGYEWQRDFTKAIFSYVK